MDGETARALNAINRAFYREAADEFDATREAPWPGWSRVLDLVAASAAPRPLGVLDVGCGNARLAAFLEDQLAEPFRYVGVDASEVLLARARARHRAAELHRGDWIETPPDEALPPGRFGLVALFGILHHVPGTATRRCLLRAATQRVAPGGLLALTTWDLDVARCPGDRILPWEAYNRGAARPIDPRRLEPGDRLLRWGDPARGRVRFCHLAGEAELAELAAEAGLEPVAAWTADGRGGDRNRYLVARPRDQTSASSSGTDRSELANVELHREE